MGINLLVFLGFCSLAMFYGSSNAVPIQSHGSSNENITLIEIGTVNGKTYFIETSQRRTWHESEELAKSVNMTLGEFVNFEESEFLASLRNLPTDGFWTGGRDAQQERQFSWNSNGAPFSGQIFNVIYTPYILSCIMFMPHFCAAGICLGPLVTSYPCEYTMFTLLQHQQNI